MLYAPSFADDYSSLIAYRLRSFAPHGKSLFHIVIPFPVSFHYIIQFTYVSHYSEIMTHMYL